ncbi:MAG TPA: tyrosine-type recombinase/integrase [Kineosporiaceae bacterium]|nr:tyrosine-type recombinase/integrase [Kineosporiaceae bacterium]
MPLGVQQSTDGHRLVGDGADVELANGFLAHLAVRNYAVASCRGYAYDLLNFLRFLADRGLRLAEVTPTDVFDYLDWQARRRQSSPGSAVVRLADRRGDAPSTINRRIAAVRGLFEYAVTTGVRSTSPVPAARRTSGLRARRGLLGHLPRRHDRDGGRLVREPHRLPDSLSRTEIEGFLGDLATHRDRAMVWLMLLGGLRAGEVRGLRLADVDVGRRQVRIVGKGGRERVVPVDRPFFTELAGYLRDERPVGCASPECFVVLRGPTAGGPLTEAGLRRIFRTHRTRSGAVRVRPHRLRHTFGTELATAGIDVLVLRDLMGHASPETTGRYVNSRELHQTGEPNTALRQLAA